MVRPAPARLVEREGLAGAGVEVFRRHAGSVIGTDRVLKGSRFARYPGRSRRPHIDCAVSIILTKSCQVSRFPGNLVLG